MSVIVIGTGLIPGLGADGCTLLADVDMAHFDSAAESWTVTTRDGHCATAEIVVDARRSHDGAVATHGIPNYFRLPGPDVGHQTRYVAACLRLVRRSGATRIEAKGRVMVHRWWPRPVSTRFYLSGAPPVSDDLYDGPATVTTSDGDVPSRVRLTGHVDAIDGRFHWQGTVFEALPDERKRSAGVTLTIADRTVAARMIERTPWGTHMIAGVGEPPFSR